MELQELSLKEWLVICRRAERTWIDRLVGLADQVSAVDEDLGRELNHMIADERGHCDAIDVFDDGVSCPSVWRIDDGAVNGFLDEHFPALMSPARPRLDRRNVSTLVNAVEAECARFYRELAQRSKDLQAQIFFQNLAEQEEAHGISCE